MQRLLAIAPELPVADVRAGINYYQNQLGFELVFEMPDQEYAIVERDNVSIHLYARPSQQEAAVAVHIYTAGLDELHMELVSRGADVTQNVVRKPWGNRDFRVRDNSGNELKFTEVLPF